MPVCYFQDKAEKESAAKPLKIKITLEILVAHSECILCQAGLLFRLSLLKPLESSGTDLGIVEKVNRKGPCSLQGSWEVLLASPYSHFASLHGLGQVT